MADMQIREIGLISPYAQFRDQGEVGAVNYDREEKGRVGGDNGEVYLTLLHSSAIPEVLPFII